MAIIDEAIVRHWCAVIADHRCLRVIYWDGFRLQGYLVLTTFSAEASLGMMVALSLLRELGLADRLVVCWTSGFCINS